MFTIVKDKEYLAFTVVSDPSNVYPLIRRFEELAPEWGLENSGRIALVLRELLSSAVMRGTQAAGLSRKVRCWVERTPEGPFKITVEDEDGWNGFGSVIGRKPDESQDTARLSMDLIRKICRSLQFNARGSRVTALVDATACEDEVTQ